MIAPHRVLWIAPQLPSNDRDGGGKRMLEMIQALTEHGSTVHVWARDAGDPDRDGLQIEDIGASWSGTSMAVRDGWRGTLDDDVLVLLDRGVWDVIVVSFARTSAMLRRTIRRRCPGVPVVIDNADLHFLRRSRMPGVSGRATGKRAELREYRLSDGVIVASADEKAILAAEIPRTPTTSFTVGPGKPRSGPSLDVRRGVMFLGALTHPPNEDAVRWWIDEIAPLIASHLGRALPLTVWGTGTEIFRDGLSDEELRYVDLRGWAPNLAAAFDPSRVFIAPLRFGAGTKSKILDGLTNGVPVVTTPTGIEGFEGGVRDACTVHTTSAALAQSVVALLRDDDLWVTRQQAVMEAARNVFLTHGDRKQELAEWLLTRSRETSGHGS